MGGTRRTVAILATGGTIAGRASSADATTGYSAGELTIDELLDALPEARLYADIICEQVASIDSKDMDDAVWLTLAKRANALLAEDCVDGIVVTHGTDTLEETAYFLNLTVHSKKPVVVTGAMRPASAVSADGPMNLLNAIRLASAPSARDRGVLVCLNDQIESARGVTKAHTTALDAFRSPGMGSLGRVNDGHPDFYSKSTRRHAGNTEFDVAKLKKLPYVKIVYGAAGDDGLFVEAAARAGAAGLVYAGPGNGSIHRTVLPALERAAKSGIVVIRSTRTGAGAVIHAEKSYTEAGFIEGGSLNPQKCRILLQLALTVTTEPEEIRRMFREY